MTVFFYLLVLTTSRWAFLQSKRKQKKSAATGIEMTLLGNQSLNWVVGIFTMTGEEKLFKWVVCPRILTLGDMSKLQKQTKKKNNKKMDLCGTNFFIRIFQLQSRNK